VIARLPGDDGMRGSFASKLRFLDLEPNNGIDLYAGAAEAIE
jgi:hypothetical protein